MKLQTLTKGAAWNFPTCGVTKKKKKKRRIPELESDRANKYARDESKLDLVHSLAPAPTGLVAAALWCPGWYFPCHAPWASSSAGALSECCWCSVNSTLI